MIMLSCVGHTVNTGYLLFSQFYCHIGFLACASAIAIKFKDSEKPHNTKIFEVHAYGSDVNSLKSLASSKIHSYSLQMHESKLVSAVMIEAIDD